MIADVHENLTWLPRPPEDFGARAKALKLEMNPGAALRTLAGHALNANQLGRLARLVAAANANGRSLQPLKPFRLGLLSNATTDFVESAIIATGLRFGLAIECVVADYGQFMQGALDPASPVNQARCDAVLVALDYRALPLVTPPADAATAADAVDRSLTLVEAMRAGLKQASGTTVICQTVAPPAEALLGSYDAVLAGSIRRQVAAFNLRLVDSLANTPDHILDVASLAETVGLASWHDPFLWNLAKQPFAQDLIPLYADHVCRLLAAMRGLSKKVLVLDLDNTVWGGIIGDDGMDGIRIAQGDAVGEAHLSLQRYALAMRERGVLIAISSKNTDEVAREVFRSHPEMLLREQHIAVFQANWDDKASNITAIAETLSLGLDSLVFVDDNPVERALVRRFLPQVAVPELPDDPAIYVRTVAAAGYFEALGFSEEDRHRAGFYADNARRVALKSQVGGIDDYLRSLDMVISLAPFDEAGRTRITQLINKSNQFNLTTRRYTEEEVAAASSDPAVLTLQVRLTDTFGDNGMISVVIARSDGDAMTIDTWLMSCRVLGRRVEDAVLAELVHQAARLGFSRLRGVYVPSGRNAMVADLYARLGFSADDHEGVGSWWTLDVSAFQPASAFEGKIERRGQAH
jgi:FkbH-like protein